MIKLPALKTAWRIYFTAIFLLVGVGLCIFLSLIFKARSQMALNTLLNGLAWGAGGWLYASRAFDAFQATLIEGEGVLVANGVWWKSEIMVPISRLQHIDVNQGPLDRRWSMARLTLHTAGTHDRGTRIYGMPMEQAYAMRDKLLPRQPLVHD
jgi:membrane protein YdbS with pleckstrin-like domain